MPAARTLLDTREAFDAGALGYEGPRNPATDGEGLIVTAMVAGLNVTPWATLTGPFGEVELNGRSEIQSVIEALAVSIGLTTVSPSPAAGKSARAA